MSTTLRVLLLIAAFLSVAWILLQIRRLKVKMEDAIFWIFFSIILLIMAIFPGFTYWLTDLFGMQSPANLIFLIIIFLLIEKVFTLSVIVSQLEEKITILSAEVALRSHSAEHRSDGKTQEQSDDPSREEDGPDTSTGSGRERGHETGV